MVAAVAHQIKDTLRLEIHFDGDLFDLGIAPESPLQRPAYCTYLIDLLGYMYRKSNNAALLGDPAADGLPHPPCAVGRELETLGVVELLHRSDKARITFLD